MVLTDLMSAALIADIPLLCQLLSAGADVHETDVDGTNALMWAIEGRSKSKLIVMTILIEAGININLCDRDGYYALHRAMNNSYRRASISLLLSYGADIDVLDPQENTALILCAVENGGGQLMGMLVAYGSDINHLNHQGDTALIILCMNPVKQTLMIQFLIDHNARIDLTYGTGQTVLHIAAAYGRNKIVRMLLSKGAEVDAVDSDGDTPLLLSAMQQSSKTYDLLIAHGADASHRNNRGQDYIALAVQTDLVPDSDDERYDDAFYEVF